MVRMHRESQLYERRRPDSRLDIRLHLLRAQRYSRRTPPAHSREPEVRHRTLPRPLGLRHQRLGPRSRHCHLRIRFQASRDVGLVDSAARSGKAAAA